MLEAMVFLRENFIFLYFDSFDVVCLYSWKLSLHVSESDVSLLHKPESLNESESDFSLLYESESLNEPESLHESESDVSLL